jgi:hypothetical protein
MFSTYVLYTDPMRLKRRGLGLLSSLRSLQPHEDGRKSAKKIRSQRERTFPLMSSVAGLGIEPSLRDYEPLVRRTLPRDIINSLRVDYNSLSTLGQSGVRDIKEKRPTKYSFFFHPRGADVNVARIITPHFYQIPYVFLVVILLS